MKKRLGEGNHIASPNPERKKGSSDMKTREKLAYMALGGVLVIAGMILGQFMFGPVYAQKNTSVSERPDADFGVIRCKQIIVGDDVNPMAVSIMSRQGDGSINTFNGKGGQTSGIFSDDSGSGCLFVFEGSKPVGLMKDDAKLVSLSADISNHGLIQVRNASGIVTTSLSHTSKGGAMLRAYNSKSVRVFLAGATIEGDGLVALQDRYGDIGWGQTGKVK